MANQRLLRTGVPLRCPACRDGMLDVSHDGARCAICARAYAADERGVLDLSGDIGAGERKQRDVYDVAPPGLGQTSDPLRAFISPAGLRFGRMLRKLKLSEGRRFLEIGCGAGPLTDSIASNTGATGVGIDISPPGIHAQHLRRGSRSHFDAFVASGTELPFPDRTFDAVVSTDLLEHLERPERFFQEAARVVKPGGRALVRVNVMDFGGTLDWWRFKLTPRRWIRKMHDLGHFYENFRTKAQHAYLARQAGMQVVFIRGFDVFWDNLLEYHVLAPLAERLKPQKGPDTQATAPPPEGVPLRVPMSLPHRLARAGARAAEIALIPERIAGMLGFGASAWILLKKPGAG